MQTKKNARHQTGKTCTSNGIANVANYSTEIKCAIGCIVGWLLLEGVVLPLMYQLAARIHGWG